MALTRSVRQVLGRLPKLSTVTVRGSMYEADYVDPHKGKLVDPSIDLPDAIGHAVGKERWEMLCQLYGWDDPFNMAPVRHGTGTWKDPFLTMSVDGALHRRHACYCLTGSNEMTFVITLSHSIPKRCQCGHWFKLSDAGLPPFRDQFKWDDNVGESPESLAAANAKLELPPQIIPRSEATAADFKKLKIAAAEEKEKAMLEDEKK